MLFSLHLYLLTYILYHPVDHSCLYPFRLPVPTSLSGTDGVRGHSPVRQSVLKSVTPTTCPPYSFPRTARLLPVFTLVLPGP